MTMTDKTPPQSKVIIVVLASSLVLLFVVVMVLIYIFGRMQFAEKHGKIELAPTTDINNIRASEDELLRNYAYVDREKKIVRIPIERAMELEASGQTWHAAYPSSSTLQRKSAEGDTTHGQ